MEWIGIQPRLILGVLSVISSLVCVEQHPIGSLLEAEFMRLIPMLAFCTLASIIANLGRLLGRYLKIVFI